MTDSELEEITALLHAHSWGTQEVTDLWLLYDYLRALEMPGLRRGRELPPVVELWERIVPIFERLNPLLQRSDFRSILPRAIVDHVASMIYECLSYSLSEKYDPESRSDVLWLAWRLSRAWCAILDGDEEDIKETVDIEEMVIRSETRES